jgi:FtsP/CotA-like multicopper oxidase with cupredoxin domain
MAQHPHITAAPAPSSAAVDSGAHLTPAREPAIIEVPPGATFDLHVSNVSKRIGEAVVPMLAYNGSIPGPTIRVRQGSEIFVNVINEIDMETTVHWHGLRLENRYDGVPHATQAPIPPGGRYTHRLTFPDAGTFWYHPHMREHYAQELGLYGNLIVEPFDSSYWPHADSRVVLTLDDILIEDGKIAAFDPHGPNFAAMGRFGNVLLVGGETHQRYEFPRGEVVRFHLTNTANTRVFKVALPGLRMKLIGGDAGKYERESFVEHVVVAPSERAIVDVRLDAAGDFTLQHVTPGRTYSLATIVVTDRPGELRKDYETLRVAAEMVIERGRVASYLQARPDKTLALVAEMDFDEPDPATATSYTCPMHPEVISESPGKCPTCGMKLMPAAAVGGGHSGTHSEGHSHGHGDALADGIEWEDLMFEVNRRTTSANTRWKAIDRDTGKANHEIDWVFTAGDQVKIRLVNEMESDHPMHHPFHIHGERFLVLSRDGAPESNLVWKDTVLIPTGQTVDILVDASNPGLWMAHCHIAEHMESGMMFDFLVRP